MNTRKKTARMAGFCYLLVVIFSIWYMGLIPSKIVVWDDPETTMTNPISNESLFRWSIFIGILVSLSLMTLPLLLYKLLHNINNNYAILIVVFALISVPISY